MSLRYAGLVAPADRERAYLERLGSYKRESHEAAHAAHLALPPAARLERSLALMRRGPGVARPRVDDPSPFFERARRLGLYRP